jgi:predicted Zn-dependent protease with MMP-like domain
VSPVELLDRVAFEELVGDALDLLPDHLAELIDNVVVVVEDRHPDEPDLWGLYEGIPLTDRADYGGLVMPDRITLFRVPLCAGCTTESELVAEIQVTVIHEMAHHFGIDDDRLTELGWA